MSLKARVTEDMKAAMRARDSQRLSAIRLLLAAIKQREVDERRDLSDADVLATIEKMVKQRRDSIAQFQAGGHAIAASGAQGPQEMGKVMALLKARLAGRVDLSKVSAIVKARLS